MEKIAFRFVLLTWGLATLLALGAGYATYRASKYDKVVIGAAVDTVVCERKAEDCGPYNLALVLAKHNQEELDRQALLIWVLAVLTITLPSLAFYLLRWALTGRWRPWWPL